LEVANEALLRRQPISGWLEQQKDALKLRDDVLREAKEWSTGDKHDDGLVRRGARLESALDLLAKPDFVAILAPASEYLAASHRLESAGRRRARRIQALVFVLFGVICGFIGWINQDFINEQWNWYRTERPFAAANIWPYVVRAAEAERTLKRGDLFRECAPVQDKDYCPEMVVLPTGSFMMGSPSTEDGRFDDEGPQHPVTIAKPFAVSKFAVTFKEWDTCVDHGDCDRRVSDTGWGRGQRPVIKVSWDDAQRYVRWLSRMTRKPYRLLTEAEYEYGARAGMETAYPWGNDIKLNGKAMANCNGCDSPLDRKQTVPVGSFEANAFGLYDVVGNVWSWVEDCYHPRYNDAPSDGSAWSTGGCDRRVARGGSWSNLPGILRSANCYGYPITRLDNLGFRVGRTLLPP
jgi:formylglycine-generating enzyme required for sulfatase activity